MSFDTTRVRTDWDCCRDGIVGCIDDGDGVRSSVGNVDVSADGGNVIWFDADRDGSGDRVCVCVDS